MRQKTTYHPTGFEERLQRIQEFVNGGLTWGMINLLWFCEPGGAEEVARALTIMESTFFHQILPEEVATLHEGGKKPEAMQQWTRFTNSLSLWPGLEILTQGNVERQARIYRFFVDVAVVSVLRHFSFILTK